MLKLSKKGGYAFKAVIFIASKFPSLIKITDLSKQLNISESLLRRIISDLDKSGIVVTIKGRSGGVKLGRELRDISLFDILLSVGEELGISSCSKGLDCDNIHNCNTTDILCNLQKSFNGILKLNTLDKIIKKELN